MYKIKDGNTDERLYKLTCKCLFKSVKKKLSVILGDSLLYCISVMKYSKLKVHFLSFSELFESSVSEITKENCLYSRKLWKMPVSKCLKHLRIFYHTYHCVDYQLSTFQSTLVS